jgi:hypothetical protein
MVALTVYSADSSALIHGWHRIYRPRNFGFVWDRLGELFTWCNERKDKLVVDIDVATQAHLTRIMAAYPRLVDTLAADPAPIRSSSRLRRAPNHDDRCNRRGQLESADSRFAMQRKSTSAVWQTLSSARIGSSRSLVVYALGLACGRAEH